MKINARIYKFSAAILLIAFFFVLSKKGLVLGQSVYYDTINKEITDLNEGIQAQKNKIQRMQDDQSKYADAIKQAQSEKTTLTSQMAILDNRLAKAQIDIELVETNIDRATLEVQKTDIEIANKNATIEKEKEHISDIIKLMYKKDNVSSLEIILLNDSLAEFLSQSKYLEDMNAEVKESINSLKKLARQLEKDKETLLKKKEELSNLSKELKEKKNALAAEKDNKSFILTQVDQSEKNFQYLLEKAKKEQQSAASEIASMERLMRAKMAKLDENKLSSDGGFIWPVPKNTITAYFHDPDYPFKKIFEHPAVDIRAGQGTPLKASASGYVARVKPGPNGTYGYIMIIHADGLSTVYGHVSKINVSEEDFVTQGQLIGLSGGLPGTPGSGSLTTGPHLHFEVRLNGIPVDPLSYLP